MTTLLAVLGAVAQLLACWMLAMVLHECGHVATALALDVKVLRVGVRWRGLYTMFQTDTPLRTFLIILAGPLSNLHLALIFAGRHCEVFVFFNLLNGVANLLPVPGSDGWQAGKIVKQFLPPRRASFRFRVKAAGGAR
jgi:Zn-dependent protease